MQNEQQDPVFFYEREFYPFSNFSSFAIEWKGELWMTSEHAYHSEKFNDPAFKLQIKNTRSAHDAFKLANANKEKYRSDWHERKFDVMEAILRAKVAQHPYVKEKLLDTGTREMIEDSWRDALWGWGPNKDGENQLGKLWMKVRADIIKEEMEKKNPA